MSTFNAPPDQINGLTLNNGDTLNVGNGGTVSGITVLSGGNLNVGNGGTVSGISVLPGGELKFDGGTAAHTILNGVRVSVSGTLADTTLVGANLSLSDGILNGITFQNDPSNRNGGVDVLNLSNPSSLQGTLAFTFVQGAGSIYEVNISFGKFMITSINSTDDALTVNFSQGLSVTYPYTENDAVGASFSRNGANSLTIQVLQPFTDFSHETAATIVYTAEFGIAPSATALNNLVSFTQAQFAYGQKIGVDAGIYAFTALGVALASSGQHFQNEFGSGNSAYPNSTAGDAKFVTDAYGSVFGHAGSAEQVQHFVDQLNYYEGIYTAAGVFGDASNIDLLARGAVYGQMLGVEHGGGLGAIPGPVFDLTEGQDTIALDQSGSAVSGTLGGADATWTPGDTIIAASGTTNESFDIQGIGPAGVINVTSVPGNRVVGIQNVNISANTAASGFADQAIKGDFTGTGPEGEWTGLKSLTVIGAGNEAGADNLTVGPETAVQITDTLTSTTSEVLTVNGSSTTTITENNLAANAGITINGGSGTTAVSIIQTQSTLGLDGIVNIIDVNGASKTDAGTITKIVLDGLSHFVIDGNDDIGPNTVIDNALTDLTVNNSDTSNKAVGLIITNNLTTPTATTLNLNLSHDGIDAAGTATSALAITDLNNAYSTVHLSLGAQNSSVFLDFNGVTTLDTPNAGTGALLGNPVAPSQIDDFVDTAVNFDFSGLNGPNNIFVDRGVNNDLDVYTLGNFGTDNTDPTNSQKLAILYENGNNTDTINFGSGAYIINDAPHAGGHSYVQTNANGEGLTKFGEGGRQWAIIDNVQGGDTLLFKTDNPQSFESFPATSIPDGIFFALTTPAHTAVQFVFNGNTYIFDHADDSPVLTSADAMVELVGTHPIAAISATHVLTFLT